LRVAVTSSGRILRAAVYEKAPLPIQFVFQLFFGLRVRRVTRCNPFVLPEIIVSTASDAAAAAAVVIVVTLTVVGIHISYPSRLRPTTTSICDGLTLVPINGIKIKEKNDVRLSSRAFGASKMFSAGMYLSRKRDGGSRDIRRVGTTKYDDTYIVII